MTFSGAPTVRTQIGPRITPSTKVLLDQAVADKFGSVSDLVDAALVRYLTPATDGADPQALFEKLLEIEQTLATFGHAISTLKEKSLGIDQALEQILDRLDTKTSAAPTPIATYGTLYGASTSPPVLPDVSPTDPLPAPHGWRRWFLRPAAATP